jgi:hypothetical protein
VLEDSAVLYDGRVPGIVAHHGHCDEIKLEVVVGGFPLVTPCRTLRGQ